MRTLSRRALTARSRRAAPRTCHLRTTANVRRRTARLRPRDRTAYGSGEPPHSPEVSARDGRSRPDLHAPTICASRLPFSYSLAAATPSTRAHPLPSTATERTPAFRNGVTPTPPVRRRPPTRAAPPSPRSTEDRILPQLGPSIVLRRQPNSVPCAARSSSGTASTASPSGYRSVPG